MKQHKYNKQLKIISRNRIRRKVKKANRFIVLGVLLRTMNMVPSEAISLHF